MMPSQVDFLKYIRVNQEFSFILGISWDGSLASKNNSFYKHRTGFCLETQHFPNSPNQKTFPSTELYPDEVYKSQTVFKLLVK